MNNRAFPIDKNTYRPCRRQSPLAAAPFFTLLRHSLHSPYGRRAEDRWAVLLRWRRSRWLYLTLAILLLCILDAVLTLTIIGHGGHEANPLMAALLERDVRLFIGIKIILTSAALIILVANVRYRLRWATLQTGHLLHLVLSAYLLLIAYELALLERVLS